MDKKGPLILLLYGGLEMKFECKICGTQWELTTFSQCDEIQKRQCPRGHPHQNCVLKAIIDGGV